MKSQVDGRRLYDLNVQLCTPGIGRSANNAKLYISVRFQYQARIKLCAMCRKKKAPFILMHCDSVTIRRRLHNKRKCVETQSRRFDVTSLPHPADSVTNSFALSRARRKTQSPSLCRAHRNCLRFVSIARNLQLRRSEENQ